MIEDRVICENCGKLEHGKCVLCSCKDSDFDYDGIVHHKCRTCGGVMNKSKLMAVFKGFI